MEILTKAKTKWLLAEELLYVLNNWQSLNMHTLDGPVQRPPSGTLVLYDKRTVRNFRRDGLPWRRKKLPGKENVIEETHTSLKCGGEVALTSYRTFLPDTPTFGRRIYWKADKSSPFVLVHYLNEITDTPPATPNKRKSLKVVTGYASDGTPITSPVGGETRPRGGAANGKSGSGRGRGGRANGNLGGTVKYRRQNKKAAAAAAATAVQANPNATDAFNLSNLTSLTSADELFSPPSTPSAHLHSQTDFSDLVKGMTGLDSVLANLTMTTGSGAVSAPASVAHSPRGGFPGSEHLHHQPSFGELSQALAAAGLPPSPPQPRSREGAPPLPPTANPKSSSAGGNGAPLHSLTSWGFQGGSSAIPPPPASSVYKHHRPLGPSQSVPNSPAHSPPASTPSPPSAPPRSDDALPAALTESQPSPSLQIVTCAPVSDFQVGGATIIVAGRFPDSVPLIAYFGNVAAETTSPLPGVLRVVTPPHPPGTVALTLVAADNSIRSNPFEFHYKPSNSQNHHHHHHHHQMAHTDSGEALFRSRVIDRLSRIQAAAGVSANASSLLGSPPASLQQSLCDHVNSLLQSVRESNTLSLESFHQEILGVDPDTNLSLVDYARRADLPELHRLLDHVLNMPTKLQEHHHAQQQQHQAAQQQQQQQQQQHHHHHHHHGDHHGMPPPHMPAPSPMHHNAQGPSRQLFGGSVMLSEDMAPPPRTQSAPPQFLSEHHDHHQVHHSISHHHLPNTTGPDPTSHRHVDDDPMSMTDISSFLGSWGASPPPTPAEPTMLVPPSSPVRESSFFDDIMSAGHPGQLNPADVQRALLALESRELDTGSSSPENGSNSNSAGGAENIPPQSNHGDHSNNPAPFGSQLTKPIMDPSPHEADAATEAMMRMSFTAASAPATPIIADLRDHDGFNVDSITNMLDGFNPDSSMGGGGFFQQGSGSRGADHSLAAALSNQLAQSQAQQAATRIQAVYRGYRTRRALPSRQPSRSAPNSHSSVTNMSSGHVIPPTHGSVAFPTSV